MVQLSEAEGSDHGRMPRGLVQSDDSAHQLGAEAYRALYEYSPDGVMFTVPDGRILAANPAACRLLGRSEEEICAVGRSGLADHADQRWDQLVVERARAGEVRGIANMVRGDGSKIEVEISARIFTESSGEPRSCIVIRDVTERERIERELARSRAHLAEAERVADMGSWESDLVEDVTVWSDGLFRIYAMPPEQFDSSLEGGIRRVYTEDRERVRRVFEDAIAQRSAFTLEYRVIRGDGRMRTFRSHGDVVVDDDGRPVRVVGVVQDVTEARLAREALQSTSAELERRAIELQQLALVAASEPPSAPRASLTGRQLEILQLIAQGHTNAAIAKRLVVTEETVKWHVKQILAKTGAANRTEAVARVLRDPSPTRTAG
jgi:PAS domain S-box-containing protein